MDETPRLILFALALPAFMGFLVGAMGARGARIQTPPEFCTRPAQALIAAIVAVVLAILAGALTLVTYGVHGGIDLPPISSDDRLRLIPGALFIIALVGLITRFALGAAKENLARPLDRIIAVLAALLGGMIGAAIALGLSSLSAPKLLALPAFAVWAALACKLLIRFHEKDRRIRAGVILIGLAAAVGAALTGTGCLVLGQYAFGAAAVSLGITIGALLLRGPTRPFTLAILTSFLATLLACGVYLSATPWWVVAVLTCVVPAAYLVDVLASRRLSPRVAAALAITTAAAISIIAIAPGIKSLADFFLHPQSNSQGE